jgi:hypothetical protein
VEAFRDEIASIPCLDRLSGSQGILPESQGQNLALTVLHMCHIRSTAEYGADLSANGTIARMPLHFPASVGHLYLCAQTSSGLSSLFKDLF